MPSASRQVFAVRQALVRHVVDARAAPRMAAGDAAGGQPSALDRPVLAQCLHRVGGAGRRVSAVGGDHRRDHQPVKPDRK